MTGQEYSQCPMPKLTPMPNLNIWVNQEDRARIVEMLQTSQSQPWERGSLRNQEFKFRNKSGEILVGLPTPRTDHAEAVAEMALDMQMEINRFNSETNQNLHLRVGINTGPVVAGVIGIKKFISNLWGGTVNTASRMESH